MWTKRSWSIPAELNEKSKRFNVPDAEKGARYDRIKDDFLWLTAAGVAIPCYNVTEPVLPLSQNKKVSLFKLFLSDVGLLTTMYGKATKLRIVNGEAGNKGGVFENVVAQELIAHGYETYYYISKFIGFFGCFKRPSKALSLRLARPFRIEFRFLPRCAACFVRICGLFCFNYVKGLCPFYCNSEKEML